MGEGAACFNGSKVSNASRKQHYGGRKKYHLILVRPDFPDLILF
jgi:hypothetical protein